MREDGFEPPMLPLGNRFTVCRNTTVVAAHANFISTRARRMGRVRNQTLDGKGMDHMNMME